jgi:hypothetical protein
MDFRTSRFRLFYARLVANDILRRSLRHWQGSGKNKTFVSCWAEDYID